MTCWRCGEPVRPCPRRCPLCRWLCDGWEHTSGTHLCGTRLYPQLAGVPDDISDVGPPPSWYREREDWAA